jgi:hypothetical protein
MPGRFDVLVEFCGGEDGDRLIHVCTILSVAVAAMLRK